MYSAKSRAWFVKVSVDLVTKLEYENCREHESAKRDRGVKWGGGGVLP